MKRVTKLVLPTLGLVSFLLVYSELIDVRDAILVVIVVEASILLFGAATLVFAVKRFRRSRDEGLDGWAAFESGLSAIMPGRISRLAVLESRLFVCFVRWMLRRTKPHENEFAYHEGSKIKPVAFLFVLASPADLLIIHILAHAFSPWAWVKWALLALGVYGILWIAALYATLPANPHRLEKNGLRLRYGVHVEAFIAYSEIRRVGRVRRESPGGKDGLHCEAEEARITVGGKTDIALRLESPVRIQGFLRKSAPANTIRLAANDPKKMEKALLIRVEEARFGVSSHADATLAR